MAKTCNMKGCNKPSFSKGWCRLHYDKLRKRTFFSMNQALKTPYSDFKNEIRLDSDNATLNELLRLGLAYHKLKKRVIGIFTEAEELKT